MKIAIEGCAHGELEKIYEIIQGIERSQDIKVDLLLCCGDFQSTRNMEDLQTMAVPKKYLDMCTFYKYYSGELVAPVLTIFIGGNHEASNYLQELPYGGWVAPNIYYLGYAGVVRVNGIRIGGLSGIYKGHDYLRGRHEFPPYTEASRKSVYHVRQLEVFRLKQLSGPIDIFMSHDWPRGIYNFGNKDQLLKFKPHFRDEVDENKLGSRPCEDLLYMLQPSLWFSAHLHCKFAALVPHVDYDANTPKEKKLNVSISPPKDKVTKFLALDKCLPKRRFLQVMDVEAIDYSGDGVLQFEYDLEWLAILRLTNHLVNIKSNNYYLPGPRSGLAEERYHFTPTPEELQQVRQKFHGDLCIPKNFCRTVEPYDPRDFNSGYVPQPEAKINPQSVQFCDILGIDDPVTVALLINGRELNYSHNSTLDDSDIPLSDSSGLLLSNQSSINLSSCTDSSILQVSPLKRKSNLNFSLPKPVNESADTSVISKDEDDLSQASNSEGVNVSKASTPDQERGLDEEAITLECDQIVTGLQLNTNPPIKKFKRRNQDIYKADSSEEEDTT